MHCWICSNPAYESEKTAPEAPISCGMGLGRMAGWPGEMGRRSRPQLRPRQVPGAAHPSLYTTGTRTVNVMCGFT